MKTYLVNNPPFKIGQRLYKKYSNIVDKDVWYMYYSNVTSLECNSYERMDWDENMSGRLCLLYNEKNGNKISTDPYNLKQKFSELNKYKENNHMKVYKDTIQDYYDGYFLLSLNYYFGLVYTRVPTKENILKSFRYSSKRDYIKVVKDTPEVREMIDYYMDHQQLDTRKRFASANKNGGSGYRGQYFTFSNMADYLISKLGTPDTTIRIIDICCGNGALLDAAVRAGYNKELMIGYDIDEKVVKECQQKGYYVEVKDMLKNKDFKFLYTN